MSNVDLADLVRDKIKSLKAYQVDNSDCEIKLHANENPYPPPAELLELFEKTLSEFELNRYPDPDSRELRTTLSQRLGVPIENLVVGNG